MNVIKDPLALEEKRGSVYPPALTTPSFDGRIKRQMTEKLGLTQFGINMTTLEPGTMSSLRHWHANEDECIYVLSGEAWLVDDTGEALLKAGMAAGFPGGDGNGHHLVNRSTLPVTYLEIGSRLPDEVVTYSDVDLMTVRTGGVPLKTRKSGEPY